MSASSLHIPTLVTLCVCGLIAGAGCGGPQRGDGLHEAFAEIQVQEARIEHAAHALTEQSQDAADACEQMRDAAERLCEVARPTEDRDALSRCARASERGARCLEPVGGDAS